MELDPFDVFDIVPSKRRDEAPEHLAAHRVVYEVTLNVKQDRMSLIEHIAMYKALWLTVAAEYNSYDSKYIVEQCKSGQNHIHGYMIVDYHPNVINIDERHLLQSFAKSFYLKLPRKYFKQYSTLKYDAHLSRLKGPALCLNLKNVLYNNWSDYMNKNAVK